MKKLEIISFNVNRLNTKLNIERTNNIIEIIKNHKSNAPALILLQEVYIDSSEEIEAFAKKIDSKWNVADDLDENEKYGNVILYNSEVLELSKVDLISNKRKSFSAVKFHFVDDLSFSFVVINVHLLIGNSTVNSMAKNETNDLRNNFNELMKYVEKLDSEAVIMGGDFNYSRCNICKMQHEMNLIKMTIENESGQTKYPSDGDYDHFMFSDCFKENKFDYAYDFTTANGYSEVCVNNKKYYWEINGNPLKEPHFAKHISDHVPIKIELIAEE